MKLIVGLPLLVSSLLMAGASVVEAAAPSEWKYDAMHSRIGFSVRHLMISTVTGRFKQATAKVLLDEQDLTSSEVALEVATDSVETGETKRDDHLRSPDFFDSKRFPKLVFKSTKIAKAGNGYRLTGNLTIRDVTKSVTLNADLSPAIKTPNGFVRGAKLTGTIKRSDFGLKWNQVLEAGGVAISDDVSLDIQVEITK